MKTLKITFLALAVVLLTVSVISANSVNQTDEATVKSPTKIDLLAHKKKEMKMPTEG
jgi:hypothetical protein